MLLGEMDFNQIRPKDFSRVFRGFVKKEEITAIHAINFCRNHKLKYFSIFRFYEF